MDVRLNSSIMLMNFIVKSEEFIIDKYLTINSAVNNRNIVVIRFARRWLVTQ